VTAEKGIPTPRRRWLQRSFGNAPRLDVSARLIGGDDLAPMAGIALTVVFWVTPSVRAQPCGEDWSRYLCPSHGSPAWCAATREWATPNLPRARG
jgi:hypothetical protein